jgi:hypothetical protein
LQSVPATRRWADCKSVLHQSGPRHLRQYIIGPLTRLRSPAQFVFTELNTSPVSSFG